MRFPLDRDFLKTQEDFIFCVVGYLHPQDRITAYLKYLPSLGGKWSDGEKRYARVLPYYHVKNVSQTIEFLKENFPRYVYHCPTQGLEMSMVPKECISLYYLPEERLKEILEVQNDRLEKDVFEFVQFLCENAELKRSDFGITGSVLLGMHNPTFSDMDLLLYGGPSFYKLKEAFGKLEHPSLRRKGSVEKERWVKGCSSKFPLSEKLAGYYFDKRWNYGCFNDRYFSIHAIRREEEIKEKYGERSYKRIGPARIKARIKDASESCFLPAVYEITDIEILEGRRENVSRLLSYEGVYCGIAEEGDVVDARGMLEGWDGSYQMVVGTTGMEGQWIWVEL